MKHKHYEMIVAKAANTELAVFYRYENDEWEEAASEMLVWDVKAEHFLCPPQHKEACLHWLNGGESQLEYIHQSYPTWNSIDNDAKDWSMGHVFMDDSLNIRIKPKKEKRWIGTCKNFVTAISYPSIDECKDAVGDDTSWEFHEIEVEV